MEQTDDNVRTVHQEVFILRHGVCGLARRDHSQGSGHVLWTRECRLAARIDDRKYGPRKRKDGHMKRRGVEKERERERKKKKE